MTYSHKEAYQALENTQGKIPEQAIEYLREAPDSEKLIDRIIKELRFAYTKEYDSDAPLFFSVVAEKHLSEKLIDPVLQLFVSREDTWWPLNLQGEYLLGALAKKYPDVVATKVLTTLEREIDNASMMPYYSLLEAFYFIDLDKYAEQIIEIYSHEDLGYVKYFSKILADMGLRQALPEMEKWQRKYEKNPSRYGSLLDSKLKGTFEEFTDRLRSEGAEYPKEKQSFHNRRGEWKPFLTEVFKELYHQQSNMAQLSEFWNEDEDEVTERANTPPDVMEKAGPSKAKIGRNDPCPCGSGKKYKNCCMGKYSF